MSADVSGIDLGTTQSLMGVVDARFPILLADGRGPDDAVGGVLRWWWERRRGGGG